MSTVELAHVMPYLAGLRIEEVVGHPKRLVVRAAVAVPQVGCPGCGVMTERVHSADRRYLADPAVGGRTATIELMVRRFFCDNPICGKKTFVEQVAGLTVRHARRTTTTQSLVAAVALALGGRPGERLLDRLAVPTVWVPTTASVLVTRRVGIRG
jgi:hypothetical protein